MDDEKRKKQLKEKMRQDKARGAAEVRRAKARHADELSRLEKKTQAKILESIREGQRLEPVEEDTSDQAYDPARDRYNAPPPKVPRRLIDPAQRRQKEKQKPRPPHDRRDHKKMCDFREKVRTGELYIDEAVAVLADCARAIRWARYGHGKKTQALRLGIIAGVRAEELAREFKISHQAVYHQTNDFRSQMKERPLVTSACADGWDLE